MHARSTETLAAKFESPSPLNHSVSFRVARAGNLSSAYCMIGENRYNPGLSHPGSDSVEDEY
jgi:hypothetical protein